MSALPEVIPYLTVAFGVVMLSLAIRDYFTLKSPLHKDYRSVIVSIGVLGTFIGIFLGLWDFDTTKIKESVPGLLEGLKLAFATSIIGMSLSAILSVVNKERKAEIEDEIGALQQISLKLNALDSLEDIRKTGIETLEQAKRFRVENRDEWLSVRALLEENFAKTNESLNQAVETLARGATEEIIKALKNVIQDFNRNLTEQFGENFKQLNEAVLLLVKWQENYKVSVEKNELLLTAIQKSLMQSKDTFIEIVSANKDTQKVYEQLRTIIETYDTQVKSLNEQLQSYSKLSTEAQSAFPIIREGLEGIQKDVSKITENVRESVNQQAEALTQLTEKVNKLVEDLEHQIPESMNELDKTLAGLTNKFKEDFEAFLNAISRLQQQISQIQQ